MRIYWLLVATIAALCAAHGNLAAADTADETLAIGRQVIDLYNAKRMQEAQGLAIKGLALCNDAGPVKDPCIAQFNEFLGDIAGAQAQYLEALSYYQQALNARTRQIAGDERALAHIQIKIGRTLVALHRNADAETALKAAVAILEKRTPVERELGVALFELTRIYTPADRAEAVDVARRTVEVYTAVQGPNGESIPVVKRFLGAALLTQADRQIRESKLAEAKLSLLEGIPLFDQPLAGWETVYAKSLLELGVIYERTGQYTEAEPYELRALDYRSKSAEPADPLLVQILTNLAAHYDHLQKPEDSVNYARRVISILDQRKQENQSLGSALVLLGRYQRRRSQYSDADATYARALEVIDRATREDDPLRAEVRGDIALLRIDEERYDDAEQQYRAVLSLMEKYAYRDTSWRSSALAGLATIDRDLGRYHDAEKLFSEAIAIDEAAGPEKTTDLANRLRGLASVLRREGRYSEAAAVLSRVLSMSIPESDRAEALNSLGLVYTTIRQYDKARPLLVEALQLERKTLPANAPLVLDTETNLAEIDLANGLYDEAEARRRDILSKVEARAAPQSTEIALHSALLANVLLPRGKVDEAEGLSRRALEIYEARLGPDHPRTAGALYSLASIEALRGKNEDAEAHYRRALGINERALGPDNPAVAGDLVALAPVLQLLGKRREAKADVDRALTIVTAQFGNESPMTVGATLAAAKLAYDEARYGDARTMLDRVRQVQEETVGPEHSSLVGTWLVAARLDIAEGKLDAAGTAIDRAAEITGKVLPPGHPFNIDVLQGKADLAAARGDLPGTEQDDRQALALADKLFGPDHPVHTQAVDRVVGILWANGERTEAEQIRRTELANIRQRLGDNNLITGRATRNLAAIFANSGRIDDAITLYQGALQIDRQAAGPGSREVALDDLALGSTLAVVGKLDEAEMALKSARTIADNRDDLPLKGATLDHMADVAALQGEPAQGVVHLEAMLNVFEQMFGAGSPILVGPLAQIGRSYLITGRVDNAVEVRERIKRLVGENPPEQSPGFLSSLRFEAMLDADRGDFAESEATLTRAIAIATKYGGPKANDVTIGEANLALTYLKARKFDDAIVHFKLALQNLKDQNGSHALIVGYALAAAASAYAGKGDKATSAKLLASAIQILGPTLAARPRPKWL